MKWMRVIPAVVGLLPLACSDQGSSTVYTGNQISDYVAAWDGYAEAFTFEDGSDRIRLRIAPDGRGTIQVGEMALLPNGSDYPVKVDAALEDAGSKLVGTLATNDSYTRYTVRLTRQ